MTDVAETPHVKFWREEEIICGKYADNIHVDLDIAKHIVEARLQFTNYQDSLCYVDIRGLRSATRDARQYLAVEGCEAVIAGAMLVESVVSRVLGNIFLTLNKPSVPVKLFTNKQDALIWLKQQKQFHSKKPTNTVKVDEKSF